MQRSVIPAVVFVTIVNGIYMDGDGLVPYLDVPFVTNVSPGVV
jgi:hypothetical protein